MSQVEKTNTLGTGDQSNESSIHEDTANQLKMAGEVQRNFLPQQLPDSDVTKWAAIWRPAEWVSGDIYDVTRLDERHVGFYIADAVGHSMPAALLTMFLKQAIVMRQTTGNDYRIFDPLEVIGNLNSKMVAQELNGCLFATCCYCLLNTQTLQLSFARAGHPYPVLIRDGKARQLENSGGLLGIFENAEFEQSTVQLQAGDKLFLYSDGCENTVGGCDDEGQFHFNDAFCHLGNKPVDALIEMFEGLVKSQKNPSDIIDDVTVIGLEIL